MPALRSLCHDIGVPRRLNVVEGFERKRGTFQPSDGSWVGDQLAAIDPQGCGVAGRSRRVAQPAGWLRCVRSVGAVVRGFGDRQYEQLFEAEYRRLVAALAVASGDREGAADAVQDAFVQAHRHWRKVSGYDDPAGWVRRVALNRLANTRRGRRRLEAALPRLWVSEVTGLPPSTVDVVQIVARLPARQRLTACLFYIGDLSIASIAEAMGVSEGTAKSQLHDARVALQASMETSDDDT
jgi:RNA polymerase sigma-70 factor, ECF subfamily